VAPGLADEVAPPWPAEEIPDADSLYMRVHRNDVVYGELKPGVFCNRPDPTRPTRPPAMSTDWSRFATPDDTRNRAESSAPHDNGVISLNVGKVRGIYGQRVEHTPKVADPTDPASKNNRALVDVFGPKSPKDAESQEERTKVQQVRFEYLVIFRWEIRIAENL
jgi:hypothetical protein